MTIKKVDEFLSQQTKRLPVDKELIDQMIRENKGK